jgi:CRP-like cAMP-binding protein
MEWPLLASLPESERRSLISSAHRKRFGRGDLILHEGEPGGTVHLVVKGRVAVRLSTARGDNLILRIIDEGGWFGELSMLKPADRKSTIIALEPVETLVVRHEQVEDVCRRVPAFEAVLVDALVAEVLRLSAALLDTVFESVHTRLYRKLVELDGIYGTSGDAPTTSIPLTQEQFAQLLGTTRPTLNKELQAAAKASHVRICRGSIEIVDRDAVRAVAR